MRMRENAHLHGVPEMVLSNSLVVGIAGHQEHSRVLVSTGRELSHNSLSPLPEYSHKK